VEFVIKYNHHMHLIITQTQADLILMKILAGIAFSFFLIDAYLCAQMCMYLYIHLFIDA